MSRRSLLKAERKESYLRIAKLMFQEDYEAAEEELFLMISRDVGIYIFRPEEFKRAKREEELE